MLETPVLLVSCRAYSLTLKMKATCSSQILDDFQWTIWCYILEDRTVIKHSLIYHDGGEAVYEAIMFI
jgi:hypothetical protein